MGEETPVQEIQVLTFLNLGNGPSSNWKNKNKSNHIYQISPTRCTTFKYTFGFLGGPLVVQKSFSDDTAVIYGVISHGHKCALENKPGVNTRVTRYIDWIKKRMSLPTQPATIITTTSGQVRLGIGQVWFGNTSKVIP